MLHSIPCVFFSIRLFTFDAKYHSTKLDTTRLNAFRNSLKFDYLLSLLSLFNISFLAVCDVDILMHWSSVPVIFEMEYATYKLWTQINRNPSILPHSIKQFNLDNNYPWIKFVKQHFNKWAETMRFGHLQNWASIGIISVYFFRVSLSVFLFLSLCVCVFSQSPFHQWQIKHIFIYLKIWMKRTTKKIYCLIAVLIIFPC